ncbi:MAG: exodeoxyribonuclease VII large subunit [Hydrogenophilus sp.]|nr:exodeoxyribonuclease VII large subunit [Hydrogenophilus sp.]
MDSNPAHPFLIYTVSQLAGVIRSALETHLPSPLWVRGEVSNLSYAPSGHCYFTLKEGDAALRCTLWRSRQRNISLPKNGDLVEAFGAITTYAPQSIYQLDVVALRPAGAGSWYLRFLETKAKLEAEGLFAPERKRPIPPYPYRVAIITSAHADALQDVLRTLAMRAPMISLILIETLVQGAQAPEAIVAAFSQLRRSYRQLALEVVLLVRGGGSAEDLAAFNDEAVARAIAASPIPVITGIGHETDTTIADFVADLRAPTPTGAAVLLSQHWVEVPARLSTLFRNLERSIRSYLREAAQRFDWNERALRHHAPHRQIRQAHLLFTALRQRLIHLLQQNLHRARHRADTLRQRLVSPTVCLSHHRQQTTQLAHRLHQAVPDLRGALRCTAALETRLRAATPTPRLLRAALHALFLRLTASRPDPARLAHHLFHRRHALDHARPDLAALALQVAALQAALEALSPMAVLERGYALIATEQGNLITRAAQLSLPARLVLHWCDGAIVATATASAPSSIPSLRPSAGNLSTAIAESGISE